MLGYAGVPADAKASPTAHRLTLSRPDPQACSLGARDADPGLLSPELMGTLRLCVLVVLLAAGVARAGNCPEQRASCVLHEEGVTLFLEGKHALAAAKFAAALGAEPTARSYLGYAQAVEALGQIALAYDTLVKAQQMSQAEVKATGPKDSEVNARAERIKYKLGELRAKIGFAWLRVPQGVQQQRVVAVQREGEGQLSAPFTQWIAVSPGKQVLIATIDDGTQLTVVAQVAAGSQGVIIIPVAGTGRPPVVDRGPVPPGPPIGGFPAPKPKPIYKKWWFWTLVIVGVLVVVSASSSSSDDTSSFRKDMFDRPVPASPPGGVTLLRF